MEENIWNKGVFKSRAQLIVKPQKVFLSCSLDRSPLHAVSSTSNCIAICKYNTLQTQPLLESPYQLPVYDHCHYPNVIQANCEVTDEFLEESSGDSFPQPVEHSTYFTLNVAEGFLTKFSFYEEEIVWFRFSSAYPLERVYLQISCESSIEYSTEKHIKDAIDQICSDSQNEYVIFNSNFEYIHQPPSKHLTSTPSPSFNNSPDKSDTNVENMLSLPPPLFLDVLGTTPTLQGYLTSKTCITVISSDQQKDGVTKFMRNSTLEPKRPHPQKVYYDNDEDDDTFQEKITSPAHLGSITPVKLRSASLSSASDFRFDDSGLPELTELGNQGSLLPPPPPSSKFIIEIRPVFEFKLQYHFILLPKHLALQFNIYNLHNVLIHAVSSGPAHSDSPMQLDLELGLNNNLISQVEEEEENLLIKQKNHIAIVRLYENEKELEQYTSQKQLGRIYDTNDLNSAYIHPELFFYLFTQTLSINPRRYLVEIEDLMVTPSSTFSQTKTHPLSMSGSKKSVSGVYVSLVNIQEILLPLDDKEEMKQYLRKHIDKLKVSKGDVFSLFTDTGRLILRVERIEPDGLDEGAGIIRDDSLCYVGSTHSFLPYFISPNFDIPSSYWEELRPPGLENYCHKLFGNVLVKIAPSFQRAQNSALSRCTVSLISGPVGVGKKTIIRAVARQCRMQVMEVNCYEIASDAIGGAEIKLRLIFDEVIKMAPCVLILKEIHVLTLFGTTETACEDEPRLLAAFESFISSAETNNSHFPVIVIGVTSELHLVSPRVQQLFASEIAMTPPTLKERRDMLQGLIRFTPISIEIDVNDIAQKTAGFVLGDFITLFSKGRQLTVKDLLSDIHVFDLPKTWSLLQDIAISGIQISQSHLNAALNILYTLHSSSIGAAKIPKVKWDDVGGMETAKKEILETIQLPLLHPELFATGLRRSGILLYGAPGTGKTLLAKAVATECSLNFISIKGPELINMYVGQTEENIREVFSRARGAAPCVVFFDELDSIAPNRGKTGDADGVMDRVVSQLLAELDGMDKSDDVFVIGATNRPDLIDPALLRPGRFDRLVYLDVCDDPISKHVILKALTRKFNLHKDVNLKEIAQACPMGLTGADLYALCADAMMIALRKQIHQLESEGKSDNEWVGQLEVCQEEFLLAVENLKPSISKEELDVYRNKKSFSNIT